MNIILKTEKVIKEWTDYNAHLNVAFYVHIFDIAADVMLDNFNMGGVSAKKDKKTTFVAEMHTTYNQEVRLGEEVETHITYVDHDKKRIHYKLSMFHKERKYLAATNEVLSLYVDLNKLIAHGERLLMHHEDVGDDIGGTMAGYLVWNGFVDTPHRAVTVIERMINRVIGTHGREIVSAAMELPSPEELTPDEEAESIIEDESPQFQESSDFEEITSE